MAESVTIKSITADENGRVHVEYGDKSGETFVVSRELEALAEELFREPQINHLAVAILFKSKPELFTSPPGDLGDDSITVTVDLSADKIIEVNDA